MNGFNNVVSTLTTAFGTVWGIVKGTQGNSGGSGGSTNPTVVVTTPQTPAKTSADTFQYVTLGVAGAALLGALFLLFTKGKR